MKRYCELHRSEIKRDSFVREKVMKILDFIVEKGSTIGFMIRDEI